jgi:hypothetical protein
VKPTAQAAQREAGKSTRKARAAAHPAPACAIVTRRGVGAGCRPHPMLLYETRKIRRRAGGSHGGADRGDQQMDVQTIDQAYSQLQAQAQQTIQEISALADKLRAAAQGGNQDAREWMLDLREVALAMQAEQNQVAALLQALHGFVANQMAPAAPPAPWTGAPAQPWGNAPAPAYPQQPQGAGLGGALGGFLNSGFGRAIEMGAGFGIGNDIVNGIFRAL